MLTDKEQTELTRLSCSRRTSVRLALRARIVLLVARGLPTRRSPHSRASSRGKWRERYRQAGTASIERDLPCGAPAVKVAVARLVELTKQSKPKAATHCWSTRKMAAELGVDPSAVW